MGANEAPDMVALRRQGVPLEAAIAQCEAWQKAQELREARLAKAAYDPRVLAAPVKPAAPEPFTAASMLHTLFSETEGGRAACLTTLIRDGWSESTAKEIAKISRAASHAFPRVTNK